MEPFTLQCTTCRARLKVQDESAVGQILECPKCGSMVLVSPAPAGGDAAPGSLSATQSASVAPAAKAPAPPSAQRPATGDQAGGATANSGPSAGASKHWKGAVVDAAKGAGAGVRPVEAARTPPPLPRAPAANAAAISLEAPGARSGPASALPALARFASWSRGSRRLIETCRAALIDDSRWLISACVLGVALSMGVVWHLLQSGSSVASRPSAASAAPEPTASERDVESGADAASAPDRADDEAADRSAAMDQPAEIDLAPAEPSADPWSEATPVAALPSDSPAAKGQPRRPDAETVADDSSANSSPADRDSPASEALDDREPEPLAADQEQAAAAAMAAEVDREDAAAAQSEQGASARRSRIESRLAERVPDVEFGAAPLGRFVDFVRELGNLPILIDEEAFKAAGKDRRSPVTVRLSGATIGEILRTGLASQSLEFELRDDRIVIFPRR